MSAKDIVEAGIKLRAAIVETFDEIGRGGKLSYTNDIKTSIIPYISAGMTFEESESVLRAAGFVVRPHPGAREEQDPNRSIDWYAVHAQMPDFPRRILGKIDVHVTLYPNSPGDYTTVKDVDAEIFVTTL